MYTRYWGLSEPPFSAAIDLKSAFLPPPVQEGLARLRYTVFEDKALALLTGEIGVGKTFVLRLFQAECARKGLLCPLVVNPNLDPREFLWALHQGLGIRPAEAPLNKARLLGEMVAVARQRLARSSRVVFLVDEAQSVTDTATIDEIRMLSNYVVSGRPLFPVILCGQPALLERIRDFPGICQRVQVSFHLPAFSREETAGYIERRLEAAGAGERAPDIIQPDAVDQVQLYSFGLPRLINNICDMALLVAGGEGARFVEASHVAKAAADRSVPVSSMPPGAEGERFVVPTEPVEPSQEDAWGATLSRDGLRPAQEVPDFGPFQ